MGFNKRKITVESSSGSTSTTKWLVSNDSGELYYSQDDNASSFSKSSQDFGHRLHQAIYDGSIWVAATGDGSGGGLYYTTDTTGLTGWTTIEDSPDGNEGFTTIVRTNDRWFAVSGNQSDLYTTTDLTASSGWSKIKDINKNNIGPASYGNGHIAWGARYSDSSDNAHFTYNTTANNFTSFTTRDYAGGLGWGTGCQYNKDNDEWIFCMRNKRMRFTSSTPDATLSSNIDISSAAADYFKPIWTGTYYIVYINNFYAYSTTSSSFTTKTTIGANANSMAYNGTVYAASCGSTASIRYQTDITSSSGWSTATISNGSGSYYHGLSPSLRVRHSEWSDLGTTSQTWG